MKIPKARKLKSGTWFIQLRLNGGSIPVTGRTERECRDRAALIKAEHLAGTREQRNKSKSDLTLKEACERYITRKENAKRSPETIRGYDVIARNRFQAVMDKKVVSIRNWQELYSAEAEKLSPKTMANTWAFIRAVCKTEANVTLPEIETVARERVEHAFLEPDEIRTFVKAAVGDKYRIALLLGLHSCRASEILAVDWARVDLKNERIEVRGALVHDRNNKPVEKAKNKTDESSRFIPIFIPELLEALEAVEDKTGKVVKANKNTLTRHSDKVCAAAGVDPVGMHGLRHSFASLCYSLNVPMKITMQIGGWKNSKIVSDIYTHLAKKDLTKHVDELKKFFNNANEIANDDP